MNADQRHSDPCHPDQRHPDLHLSADLADVRRLGPWLEGLVDHDRALFERLELAVHEVCVNVVDHAYQGTGGALTVRGAADPARIQVEVIDSGVPFEQSAVVVPRPGVPQVGGYGLMIVRQLVDSLEYHREGGHNRWVLTVARGSVD